MKKIKNIGQLQAEKMRISLEQRNQEEKMRTNLRELKASLRPVNLVKDTIVSTISNKASGHTGSNIRKGLVIFGMSLLARKLVGKMISKVFKK